MSVEIGHGEIKILATSVPGGKAIFDWWLTPDHRELPIWNGIKVYAPSNENDVDQYRKVVRLVSKLDLNRKAKDLSSAELARLVNAMEQFEGKFKPVTIIETPEKKKKITAVKKDKKGTIIKYCVETLGWISKAKAIALTSQGEIDAVVATSRSGNFYLKSRPDGRISNNLENLG